MKPTKLSPCSCSATTAHKTNMKPTKSLTFSRDLKVAMNPSVVFFVEVPYLLFLLGDLQRASRLHPFVAFRVCGGYLWARGLMNKLLHVFCSKKSLSE